MKIKEAAKTIMSNTLAKLELHISGSGLPCLWEEGGGWTNTGSSRIICDHFGNAKTAIYVLTHGDLCNGKHALIPVAVGDMVVEADRHREKYQIFVWKIIRIDGDEATLRLLEYCRDTTIDNMNVYCDAVSAAMEKASDYHCRDIHFAWKPFHLCRRKETNISTKGHIEVDIK